MVVVWSAGILARINPKTKTRAAGRDGRAPVSFKTKPGSLLDANSPVVNELVHAN